VQTLLQDIRYALRQLRHAPTFTLTALLTLAIDIGATTAIFTLTQAIMLKSLPVADPAQLYRIGDTGECCVAAWEDDDWSLFSYPLYQRLAAAVPEFEETTAFRAAPGIYSIRQEVKDREARPLRAECRDRNVTRAGRPVDGFRVFFGNQLRTIVPFTTRN